MRRLRLWFPIVVIVALLLLLAAPLSVSAAPLQNVKRGMCTQYYVVRWGDTLASIARRFGTSVQTLQALNGISNPNYIISGRRLCVRGSGGGQTGGFWYPVHPGDTLYRIARMFGWSVGYLASINHLANPNLIYVGQRLWIPYHY